MTVQDTFVRLAFRVALLALLVATSTMAQAGENYVVPGRFEAGPVDGALTFVFNVSPPPKELPKVRWLGPTPRHSARTLAVHTASTGRYSAVLADVPREADGRVVIELSDLDAESYELHSADFAMQEHIADGRSSLPSRDGRFVVFTRPEGVARGLGLLIGSVEQPLEGLPPGVTRSAVLAAYTLDFLPASDPVIGWQLTVAVAPTDPNPVLFYFAKGGTTWKVLDSTAIERHPLLSAGIAGPGTYLLVRRSP